MSTFRIYYKGYYREHSEFMHMDVLAQDERAAVREFFKEIRNHLRESDLLDGSGLPDLRSVRVDGEYKWWEGDWLQVYRRVKEVDVVPCPLCEGSGEVDGAVARGFAQQPA